MLIFGLVAAFLHSQAYIPMVVSLITSCATLAMVPASGMLMGSLSVYMISLNRVVLACLQCLGAGLILGAIGSELLPHLAAIHAGLEGTISITAGFFLGIVTMFYVKSIAHDQGEGEGHCHCAVVREDK